MKRLIYIITALLSTTAALAQPARHVVLVTIDGFRPDFYTDATWGMVNLQQLMQEGVFAEGVNSVFPSVTFPAHTTIITGVQPAQHGVYFNDIFEPGIAKGRWYADYDSIKVPTLFDAVQKAGMTSASIIWPVSVGAPITYNIPDIWEQGGNTDRRAITARYATPKGLYEELEQHATGHLEANDFNMDKDYLAMDENIARMGGYLIRKYRPALTMVHLPCADHAEHAEGRDGQQVRRAVAGADHALRILVEAIDKAGIKDSTAIIVTGDHGFVSLHTRIFPNVWLAEAGLVGDVDKGDWKAVFHSGGGSCFLQLKDRKDKKTIEKVKQVLAALPEDQKKLFRVIDRSMLDKIGADPNAVLALAAAPGVTIGGNTKGEAVKPAKGGTHGYFPDFKEIQTGFVGYGAGFRKGASIAEMDLKDMAPLVAKLLGLPFSAQGKAPAALLKEQ